MIEYIEIKEEDYNNLKDQSGYYKIITIQNHIAYVKDTLFHRVDGPAFIYTHGRANYYLNGNYCNHILQTISDEYWIKWVKLQAFQ